MEATYIIVFQIRQYNFDYTPLYHKIKSISSNYIQAMDYLWFISSEMAVEDIVKELTSCITHNDLLFVTGLPNEVKKDGYLLRTAWDFLKWNE